MQEVFFQNEACDRVTITNEAISPCILAQYNKRRLAWYGDTPGDLHKLKVIFKCKIIYHTIY